MQHNYFAASNSSEGFKCYYQEIFERADKLYIITGGPGTGKSSLMRRIAGQYEKEEARIERYFCSSDPSSLDGVLIFGKDRTVGVVDGTAPHIFEPTLPGARDEIVNLGQFWNASLLRGQKNEIIALTNKKSAAYKRAYDYLRSCGNLRAVIDLLLRYAVDQGKLDAAASRLIRTLDLSDGKPSVVPSLLRAVAMTGKHCLDSYEKNASQIFYVSSFYGVGQTVLDSIRNQLLTKQASLRFSYDPVNPKHLDGIYIEDTKTAFVLTDSDANEAESIDKTVNPKRFVAAEKLREIRGELRYAARLYQDSLDGALHALSEAKVYHFLLEDIYKNAMDFAALTEFTRTFAASLD